MTKQQPDLENARLVSKEGREQQLEASVDHDMNSLKEKKAECSYPLTKKQQENMLRIDEEFANPVSCLPVLRA